MWEDATPIQTVEPVDRARFESEIVAGEMPVVIRGQVRDWPLVGNSPPELCAMLAARATRDPVEVWRAGPDQRGRFDYTSDLSGFAFERLRMPVTKLFETILSDAPDRVFAGAIPLPQVMPRLIGDLPMPSLAEGEERLTSLWIGNGSTTAAHWDLSRNLACVVAGRRRFVLMPPDQLRNLYVGPIDRTLAGQPSSLVDFDAPDFVVHPKFRDAIPHARVAWLEPGDALYIPAMWWHHVTTPPPFGAQINFWWRDAAPHMTTPLFALYHALLTIRDLPPAERAAWRAHFDHYVFGGDVGVAHLPTDRRGVLGTMNPEMAEAMRQFLIGALRD